jgi:hypothetical protein
MAKSDYRVGIGQNVILTSLAKFNPQPRSLGVRYTRRNYMGDGSALDDGPYIELLWSALDSEIVYQSLLTQAGLSSDVYRNVTIYARDETWKYFRYNGMIIRPSLGNDADWEYFPRNIVFLVRDLIKLP